VILREFEQGIEIVAKNMLKSGKPIAEIMEMTGLSEEQIKNLDPVNQHRNQANPNA
jgi:hypothetical protein